MDCQFIGLIAGRYDDEGLYRYYLEHHPFTKVEDIQSFHALSMFELVIDFKDGTRELYDMSDNTRRGLPRIDAPLSDEQHRKEFPKRLQYWMRIRNVNQQEMADRLKTTQPMINKYLTGRAYPGYVRMKRMAEILRITVDDLYLNI